MFSRKNNHDKQKPKRSSRLPLLSDKHKLAYAKFMLHNLDTYINAFPNPFTSGIALQTLEKKKARLMKRTMRLLRQLQDLKSCKLKNKRITKRPIKVWYSIIVQSRETGFTYLFTKTVVYDKHGVAVSPLKKKLIKGANTHLWFNKQIVNNMAKLKMGFSGLTVTEQIERARLIVTSMTGNANYATPSPTLASVTAAADALEIAYNESRGRDMDKVAIMYLRRKDLMFLISQLAAYVQQASGADEEKILSSGFDVRSSNTPHPDTAGTVGNLRLSDGSMQGRIKVEYDEASDAVLYVIESSLTADFADNDMAGATTKTQKEIGTFETGTRVYVRVFAFGRENPGPPCDVASILIR